MKEYEGIIEHSFEFAEEVRSVYRDYRTGVRTYPLFDPREEVARLMQGAIDIHSHVGPCSTSIRRNEIEYGIRATEVGMRAIISKSLTAATARSAAITQEAVDSWAREHNKKPCQVIGGVTLCQSVGGLNPEAVENAAQFGGKFVWTPVLDSSHQRNLAGTTPALGRGIDVLDDNDEVVPQLKEIFKLVAEYDLVLSICHHTVRERLIMVDTARELGVKRIALVHVFQPVTRLDVEQMKMFVAKGCYLEHLFHGLGPYFWRWEETLEAFKQVGYDRFVLGSDLGNWRAPDPVDMYQITIGLLLEHGIPETEVAKLVRVNAERLICGEP